MHRLPRRRFSQLSRTTVANQRLHSSFGFFRLLRAYRPAEQARIVGDDAVNAQVCEAPHIRGRIDGPDKNFLSGSFYFANQLSVDQCVMGNHILDRKFAPKAELSRGLTDQTEWHRGIQGMHRFERSGLKRGDNESPAWLVPQEEVERNSLQPLHLQLDIEKGIAVALKHIP